MTTRILLSGVLTRVQRKVAKSGNQYLIATIREAGKVDDFRDARGGGLVAARAGGARELVAHGRRGPHREEAGDAAATQRRRSEAGDKPAPPTQPALPFQPDDPLGFDDSYAGGDPDDLVRDA